MDDFWVGVTSATWLGVLTSISPCPLATNIAAISYIGKQADRPRTVLLTGTMYTLGRTFTYVTLGCVARGQPAFRAGLVQFSPALHEQAARPNSGSGWDVSSRPVAPAGAGSLGRIAPRRAIGTIGRLGCRPVRNAVRSVLLSHLGSALLRKSWSHCPSNGNRAWYCHLCMEQEQHCPYSPLQYSLRWEPSPWVRPFSASPQLSYGPGGSPVWFSS